MARLVVLGSGTPDFRNGRWGTSLVLDIGEELIDADLLVMAAMGFSEQEQRCAGAKIRAKERRAINRPIKNIKNSRTVKIISG